MRAPYVIAALTLTGCSEILIDAVDVVDAFTQSPFEKVDVLLVVDDSCSMAPYQQKLGSDFGGFFDYFADGNVDWRLAVTTTDVSTPDFGSIRGPIVGPDAVDPAALFSEVVQVGTGGGGLETGLAAAARVLKNPRDGFPRDDAAISVIFVSDEEDASPESVSDYVGRYYDLRGQRHREAFHASALVVSELADCTPEQFAVSSRGTRYEKAALLTDGVVANLCVDDLGGIVNELALTTSALVDTFFLRTVPDPLTLRVQVAGVDLPCEEGGWRYDRVEREGQSLPAIVFEPGSIPDHGSEVLVEYLRGVGDPADFCPEATP